MTGCKFCGYPDYYHPVESVLRPGETLCESFVVREEGSK